MVNKLSTRLTGYALYFLDYPGRIAHQAELNAESDDEAIRQATERADGRAMELWRGAFMVRRFSASSNRR